MLHVIEYFAKLFKDTQCHSKWYHSKAWARFPSYSHSIVTTVLSGIICEIKRNIGRFLPLAFDVPLRGGGGPRRNTAMPLCIMERLNGAAILPGGKKLNGVLSCFDTIPGCDRRTDRQTPCDGIVRAMYSVAR